MGKYIAPLDPDVRALVRENADLRAYASEHDPLREAVITIRDLTARAVTAEADLAVVVEFLRAVCHASGESPDYWIGFLFDGGSSAPATLRRLLTEEQT